MEQQLEDDDTVAKDDNVQPSKHTMQRRPKPPKPSTPKRKSASTKPRPQSSPQPPRPATPTPKHFSLTPGVAIHAGDFVKLLCASSTVDVFSRLAEVHLPRVRPLDEDGNIVDTGYNLEATIRTTTSLEDEDADEVEEFNRQQVAQAQEAYKQKLAMEKKAAGGGYLDSEPELTEDAEDEEEEEEEEEMDVDANTVDSNTSAKVTLQRDAESPEKETTPVDVHVSSVSVEQHDEDTFTVDVSAMINTKKDVDDPPDAKRRRLNSLADRLAELAAKKASTAFTSTNNSGNSSGRRRQVIEPSLAGTSWSTTTTVTRVEEEEAAQCFDEEMANVQFAKMTEEENEAIQGTANVEETAADKDDNASGNTSTSGWSTITGMISSSLRKRLPFWRR